jgi:hypothetical protein
MTPEIHLALAEKARQANTQEALAFLCCNETQAILPYRQAALVAFDPLGRSRFCGHSGLASVECDSPYGLWLAEVALNLKDQLFALPIEMPALVLYPEALPEALAESWGQWMPAHVCTFPLTGPDGKLRAALFLAREEPWPEEIPSESPIYWLIQTIRVYGHAWWALSSHGWRLQERIVALSRNPRVRRYLPLMLLFLLFPVREYALVPAEVVSLASQVIASPQEGVIREIKVLPNTEVKKGDVLAELDDTTLHNRVLVAKAALDTARADLLQSSQRAFERQDAKAEIGMAEGRFREKEAELNSLKEDLSRLQIVSPATGVFVYSNPDDWSGKPVQTGERIGFLADPMNLGVQLWVPVGEAINLKPSAPITLFLRVAPLSPLSAQLNYASYQVTESPDGIASYRVRGTLTEKSTISRIGLRGTARVGGDWSVLGYIILRRPLASFREWCGC